MSTFDEIQAHAGPLSNVRTRYSTQHHAMAPQICPSVSGDLCPETKPHNVESISQIRRTSICRNQELYKHSYLSPYKPSISRGLHVGERSPSGPVNQDDVAVFTLKQRVFKLFKPGVAIVAVLTFWNELKWNNKRKRYCLNSRHS